MARFIRQEDIPMKIRRPHINRYRRQLRDGLLNPGLTSVDRAILKVKLAEIGQPKVYGRIAVPGATPAPGAVETNEVSPKTREDLLVLSKDELLNLAQTGEVEAFKSWDKARIVDAILAQRAAKSS